MIIYIYGTGSGAQKLYEYKLQPEVVIKGFLDSDSKKWGGAVPFAPQYRIGNAENITEPFDYILVASVYSEIYDLLVSRGIPKEKICFLNDYANNDILNRNNARRYEILRELLNQEYLCEVARVEHLFPQGNYSSPVVDVQYVQDRKDIIFQKELPEKSGISINMAEQLKLLHQFSKRGELLPFCEEKTQGLRYYGKNDMFYLASAHILSQMMMQYRPKRVIEAGSGFSSAVMLDMNENMLENEVELSFIEPHADRLKSLLKDDDHIRLLEKNLQEVPTEYFERLGRGDILFIDSSHVGKTGSDVNYILFHILPILKSGVIIHFHDMFYPFEYPEKWVYEGRGWNEAYMLRAFLQYNREFHILFWDSAIRHYVESGKISLEPYDRQRWLEGESLYIQKE